jgi:hypothetical protein
MPITPFLNGRHFDAETKRIMGVAFEMARSALRLPLRDDQSSKCSPRRSFSWRQRASATRTCSARMH